MQNTWGQEGPSTQKVGGGVTALHLDIQIILKLVAEHDRVVASLPVVAGVALQRYGQLAAVLASARQAVDKWAPKP